MEVEQDILDSGLLVGLLSLHEGGDGLIVAKARVPLLEGLELRDDARVIGLDQVSGITHLPPGWP